MSFALLLILSTLLLGTTSISLVFFNVQSYRILAGWQGGVRTEEQCLKEEEENLIQDKKRRVECEDTEETENGIHGEFQ